MASNQQRVVVGIDDSATARRALAWAVDEAAALGVELDVVHVYDLPLVLTPAPLTPPKTDTTNYEQQANDTLRRLVSEALATAPERPPALQQIAVEAAHPGRALVARAKDADVLVVGSRGRGQLASVVLGSVGHYCVHHAPCRVVVVPSRSQA